MVERISDLFNRNAARLPGHKSSNQLEPRRQETAVELTSFWHSWNSRVRRLLRAGLAMKAFVR